MQVIEGNPLVEKSDVIHKPSLEDLQNEFDYFRAERLIQKLLEEGFITPEETRKITALNRQVFKPLLAPLMPDKP
jgi:hypothetical protein